MNKIIFNLNFSLTEGLAVYNGEILDLRFPPVTNIYEYIYLINNL